MLGTVVRSRTVLLQEPVFLLSVLQASRKSARICPKDVPNFVVFEHYKALDILASPIARNVT
jgi:hypothetical protein